MADSSHGDYQPGNMDIREHVKTWHLFTGLVKWGIIANVAILVFLALFRTHG